MKAVAPVALFRLPVLGPLVSRDRLERGELQQIIRELATGITRFPVPRAACADLPGPGTLKSAL
jgi:hypothetical protein